ncbi:MAG: hypothetical protein OEU36_17930 [Gammaproteobacteria bacterium]|nr:hypothetical protein [Gammaproteobacteria bacterium]
MDIKSKIKKLEGDLARVDQSISELESVKTQAEKRGPISPLFESHLEEIRMQRERLTKRLSDLRLQDAESWTDSTPWDGYTAVWDNILGRVFHLVDELKAGKHGKKQ